MLPVEIQEQILDHLHNDIHALRACCLTSSSWVPRTRFHLFRSVRLYSRKSCLRFLGTLESTSQLDESNGVGVGGFVRELRLPAMSLHRAGAKNKVGLGFDLLCRILRYLPNVETMDTDCFDWNGFVTEMLGNDIDRGVDLRQAFAAAFDFPRLKTLHIRNVAVRSQHELFEFIAAFPSIERLKYNGAILGRGFPNDAEMISARTAQDRTHTVHIQELSVATQFCYDGGIRSMLEGLRQPPFELSLRRLRWKSADEDSHSVRSIVPAVTEILHDAAGTLRELDITLIGSGESE